MAEPPISGCPPSYLHDVGKLLSARRRAILPPTKAILTLGLGIFNAKANSSACNSPPTKADRSGKESSEEALPHANGHKRTHQSQDRPTHWQIDSSKGRETYLGNLTPIQCPIGKSSSKQVGKIL